MEDRTHGFNPYNKEDGSSQARTTAPTLRCRTRSSVYQNKRARVFGDIDASGSVGMTSAPTSAPTAPRHREIS